MSWWMPTARGRSARRKIWHARWNSTTFSGSRNLSATGKLSGVGRAQARNADRHRGRRERRHAREFTTLLAHDAVSYVQPSVTKIGGIGEMEKVFVLADAQM